MTIDATAQFAHEGDPAFPSDTGNDNPADSPSENTDTDQSPSSGEDNNTDANTDPEEGGENGGDEDKGKSGDFAKHPRWQEREEDWKNRFNEQEERHKGEMDEMRTKIEELSGKFDTSKENQEEIPDWFGGDEKAWASYQAHQKKMIEEAEERAVAKALERTKAGDKAIDDATDFMQKEITAIQSDKELNPDGHKFTSQEIEELLRFTMEEKFVDFETRNWDYRRAYRHLKNSKFANRTRPDNSRRKAFAAATTDAGARPEESPSNVTSSSDFDKNPGRRPW